MHADAFRARARAGVLWSVGMVLALVVIFSLAACSHSDDRVAGRVFDYEITEQQVIDYMTAYREGNATTDDEQWAAWLEKKGTTAKALREETVRYYAQNWLVERAAGMRGVEVDEDELQSAIEEQKSKYPSDIAWTRALINSGYTEDAYALTVKSDLLKRKIKETFADPAAVSDDELESYANRKIDNSSTKRTSAIFIACEEGSHGRMAAKAKAQQARNELKAGAKFSDVFAKYSDTTYSEDGDMGYDMVSVPNTQYRKALATLDKEGDISDVVEAQDGYYVVVCAERFEDREGRSLRLKEFPQELLDEWRSELAAQGSNEDYNEFYTENVSDVDVAIEPMPQGLPYDVETEQQQQ